MDNGNMLLIGGRIITEEGILERGYVRIEDGLIADVGQVENGEIPGLNLEGLIISPGFIDIHAHGGRGYDFMDGSMESCRIIAQHKAEMGVTAFLATTLTALTDDIDRALECIARFMAEETVYKNILGIHMEGPFISPEKKGAQNPRHIIPPSLELLRRWYDLAYGKIRIITLAPEMEGALPVIEEAARRGIVAACGHTNATYEETRRALDLGLSHGVHLFNGMRGFHHREPGVAGALLEDKKASVELIMDGYHLHPAVVRLVLNIKEQDQVVVVTDSMRASGMEEGRYELGGQEVLIKNGVARLLSGSLAGSICKIPQGLANIIKTGGLDLAEAVKLVSLNPARILGTASSRGSIKPGKLADITVFDRDFRVLLTLVRGIVVYNALDEERW